MQTRLNTLHSNISATIQSMQSVRQRIDSLPGGPQNLASAAQSLQKRINSEQTKMDNVERLSQSVNTFISNAVQTDMQVSSQIIQNQDQFIANNPWAGASASKGKSNWERFLERIKRGLKTAGEWIKKAWNGIVTFVKEHAVEIIIGAVAIIIGAAIIALTGGAAAGFLAAFGSALLAGLKAAALSAIVGSAISGVIALFTGDNILEAMGDGLASGFMWGGIFFALSAAFSAAKPMLGKLKEKISTFASQKIAVLKDHFLDNKTTRFFKKISLNIKEMRYKLSNRKPSNLFDNIQAMRNNYQVDARGWFGVREKNCQILRSSEPIKHSKEFFDQISKGGFTTKVLPKGGSVKVLDDGTYITHRIISTSGPPAVELHHIPDQISKILFKNQKIHFLQPK